MGYFQVTYCSSVVIYDCRAFIRLTTGGATHKLSKKSVSIPSAAATNFWLCKLFELEPVPNMQMPRRAVQNILNDLKPETLKNKLHFRVFAEYQFGYT